MKLLALPLPVLVLHLLTAEYIVDRQPAALACPCLPAFTCRPRAMHEGLLHLKLQVHAKA